jgi:DNA-binding transcriptional LysR family regulator
MSAITHPDDAGGQGRHRPSHDINLLPPHRFLRCKYGYIRLYITSLGRYRLFINAGNDGVNLENVDLNLLLVFHHVFREKRVHLAAKNLGMSQRGVSDALSRLRSLLNDELFVRTAGGMEPTSYAVKIAAPISQALVQIRGALDVGSSFDPATSTRRFTIAMTDIGEIDFLPRLMDSIGLVAPLVSINTVRNNAVRLREEMESGQVNLAVGLLPDLQTNFFKRQLTVSEYVCLVRRGHALDKPHITIEEFLAASHLVVVSAGTGHGLADEEFERRGIVRNVKLRIPHFAAVGYLLHKTDLITTVPRRLVDRCLGPFDLSFVAVPFELPSISIDLFWSARYHRDPANQWLRNIMVDTFNKEAARRSSTNSRAAEKVGGSRA